MVKESSPTARTLGRLFIDLGIRYDTAQNAAERLSALFREDDSLKQDAISIWCSIVETESPVHEHNDDYLYD